MAMALMQQGRTDKTLQLTSQGSEWGEAWKVRLRHQQLDLGRRPCRCRRRLCSLASSSPAPAAVSFGMLRVGLASCSFTTPSSDSWRRCKNFTIQVFAAVSFICHLKIWYEHRNAWWRHTAGARGLQLTFNVCRKSWPSARNVHMIVNYWDLNYIIVLMS
jgi:hypothetical protein